MSYLLVSVSCTPPKSQTSIFLVGFEAALANVTPLKIVVAVKTTAQTLLLIRLKRLLVLCFIFSCPPLKM